MASANPAMNPALYRRAGLADSPSNVMTIQGPVLKSLFLVAIVLIAAVHPWRQAPLLGSARADQPKLALHAVPIPVNSNRLLGMSMDDDGVIWVGGFHGAVHRYDPRTGNVDTLDLPHQPTASACICASEKVYILGQQYPRLTIYDRSTKQFTEVAYPSDKPNVWYGTEAFDGRHIYLFDRGSAGGQATLQGPQPPVRRPSRPI